MENAEYRAMFDVEMTHWWFVSRRSFIETVFEAITVPSVRGPVSAKIADIGAGTGGMIRFLERYGAVTGIEPNPAGRTLATKRGIRLRSGTAERTGIPSGSMDIVCIMDVLYHRGINDGKALAEAFRILRPGGVLLITDSALPWLSGPHDNAVAGRIRYVLSDLSEKVGRAGFTVRKQTYTFFLVFPVFALKRLWDRYLRVREPTSSDVKPVHPVINRILSVLCRLESLGLPYVSYPWGSSLLLLADKRGAR